MRDFGLPESIVHLVCLPYALFYFRLVLKVYCFQICSLMCLQWPKHFSVYFYFTCSIIFGGSNVKKEAQGPNSVYTVGFLLITIVSGVLVCPLVCLSLRRQGGQGQKNHVQLIWKISLQGNKCFLQNFKILLCSKLSHFEVPKVSWISYKEGHEN